MIINKEIKNLSISEDPNLGRFGGQKSQSKKCPCAIRS